MPYQYATDAADLVGKCISQLHNISSDPSFHSASEDLLVALFTTEKHLYEFIQSCIEHETHECAMIPDIQEELAKGNRPSTLPDAVLLLKRMMALKKKRNAALSANGKPTVIGVHDGLSSGRNASNTLLFRLVVTLQLALFRENDVQRSVQRKRQSWLSSSSSSSSSRALGVVLGTGTIGLVALYGTRHSKEIEAWGRRFDPSLAMVAAKASMVGASLVWLRSTCISFWLSMKITKSTAEIDEWNRHWRAIQPRSSSLQDMKAAMDPSADSLYLQRQSDKLVQYALDETPKHSLLFSQGELRFMMLKRAMDVFYASVGTAMKVTKGRSEPDWQLTIVTAAAATFYSLTGARQQAASITSSSKTAGELIQNAWGMVSLPTVKYLSLQASKILKGAAVADRIEVNGVSCFVLSYDPAPELASLIQSFQRNHDRKAIITLKTITEDEEEEDDMNGMVALAKPFAGSESEHRQRDVILHLTGGGFFAHIIASDLPFLLDWSRATGAVILCPEYGLLPEHTFPYALQQVEDVYRLLRTDAPAILGFETNRLVVTGESAGGNLAAALCTKIAMEGFKHDFKHDTTYFDENPLLKFESNRVVPMPDALMLSCPVLNLSLELSHSRVLGTEDPVLPSGLISAISDAYLPPRLGISKKFPLASPIFTSDTLLEKFPPTLIIASSKDPLLDDSVAFNTRLRSVGVPSELCAAENVPHAYLGLGTAGFPEAIQVQQHCQKWLAYQLTRDT